MGMGGLAAEGVGLGGLGGAGAGISPLFGAAGGLGLGGGELTLEQLMAASGTPMSAGFNVPFTASSGMPATAAGGGALGTLGTVAQGGSTLSSLKNILSSGGTVDDWLRTIGALAPIGLGLAGSLSQQGQLEDLASQYASYGAPSRGRYEASFAPGFSMANEPGYMDALNQSAKGTLHGLSVQGNPSDSPNAWAQSLQDLTSKFSYPALQQFRNQNAATGGYGAFNAAAPTVATGAIDAGANAYNVGGIGLANIFNPPKTGAQSLAEILAAMRGFNA
jgi:hypothetical protein